MRAMLMPAVHPQAAGKEVHCTTFAGVENVLTVDGKGSDCQAFAEKLQEAVAVFQGSEAVGLACFGNTLVVPGEAASVCDAAAAEVNALLNRYNLGKFTECVLTTTTSTSETTTTTTTLARCGAGQLFVDNGCLGCPADTYQDETNHRTPACKQQTLCGLAQRASPDNSKSAARTCSSCGDNTYQGASSHRSTTCDTQTLCGQAEFISGDSKTAARSCSSCGADTYQQSSSHRDASCKSQTLCGAGTFLGGCGLGCGQIFKRTCESCNPNTYQDSASHRSGSCKKRAPCPAGQSLFGASVIAAGSCA